MRILIPDDGRIALSIHELYGPRLMFAMSRRKLIIHSIWTGKIMDCMTYPIPLLSYKKG